MLKKSMLGWSMYVVVTTIALVIAALLGLVVRAHLPLVDFTPGYDVNQSPISLVAVSLAMAFAAVLFIGVYIFTDWFFEGSTHSAKVTAHIALTVIFLASSVYGLPLLQLGYQLVV